MAPSLTAQPPPHFPANVQYLTTPVPSRLLSAAHRQTFCTPCPPHLLPNPPPRIAIRTISDPRHPANGQSGLFNASNKALPRGTWIRDYVGWVHTEGEADPTSGYDLALDRIVTDVVDPETGEASQHVEVVGCDATRMGGEARFVNDYRGVPGFERPNAVFELRSWDVPGQPGKTGVRMAVWAGPHGVDKGSEICVSYGKGYWRPQEPTTTPADSGKGAKSTKKPAKSKKG